MFISDSLLKAILLVCSLTFWGLPQFVESRVLKTVLGKQAWDSYDTLDPWQDQGTRQRPMGE